jgi:hypothetical protein
MRSETPGLYSIKFGSIWGRDFKVVAEFTGADFPAIRTLFWNVAGLEIRVPKVIFTN